MSAVTGGESDVVCDMLRTCLHRPTDLTLDLIPDEEDGDAQDCNLGVINLRYVLHTAPPNQLILPDKVSQAQALSYREIYKILS